MTKKKVDDVDGLVPAKRQRVDDALSLLRRAESDPSGFVGHENGIDVVASLLADAVSDGETTLVHACLGCLENLPITLEVLQSSRIGKRVNECMKQCINQAAVDRARTLINSWKGIASSLEEKPVEEVATDDALASLLDSLPDIEALMQKGEERRIRWRKDDELVQAIEFGIMETCEDLRRRIDETHGGGRLSLHPHGNDSGEEARRFHESRKKERAMGGNRLRMHLTPDEMVDDADDLAATFPVWTWPVKVKILGADLVFDPKKLLSYERQDLADMHGHRPELVYHSDMEVPDSPSEPSGTFKMQQNTTIDILLGTGLDEPIDLEGPSEPAVAAPVAAAAGTRPPPPPAASTTLSFDDEFVKVDSKLQTVILGSSELLKLFTKEPQLLRDITLDKLSSMTMNRAHVPHTVPPPPPPLMQQDIRRGWGAATIRTAVRQEVMTSFATRPGDFPAPHHGGPPHMYQPPPRPQDRYTPGPPPHHGRPPMRSPHYEEAPRGPPPFGGPHFYSGPPQGPPGRGPPHGPPPYFEGRDMPPPPRYPGPPYPPRR